MLSIETNTPKLL